MSDGTTDDKIIVDDANNDSPSAEDLITRATPYIQRMIDTLFDELEGSSYEIRNQENTITLDCKFKGLPEGEIQISIDLVELYTRALRVVNEADALSPGDLRVEIVLAQMVYTEVNTRLREVVNLDLEEF